MRWTNQQPLSLPRMQTFLGLCHARVSPPLTVEGYQVLKRLCGRLTQSNSCIVVSLLVFFSSVTISSSNGNRSNWCQFIVDPLDTEKIDSVACVGGVCNGREGEGFRARRAQIHFPFPFERLPSKLLTLRLRFWREWNRYANNTNAQFIATVTKGTFKVQSIISTKMRGFHWKHPQLVRLTCIGGGGGGGWWRKSGG